MSTTRILLILLTAGSLTLSACAPKSYAVRMPQPTAIKYQVGASPATTLSVVDERRPGELFSTGILPAGLTIDGAALNPPKFLADALSAELKSRGLPANAAVGDAGQPRIRLKTFTMSNHRVSGFSPFVTLTFLSADVETAAGTQRVGAFVKRGKVPVWSFSEVIDPIFNDPLSIVAKEFATKVANLVYDSRASEATVQELAGRLATRSETSFMDVYALGFANNPAAIPKIVELLADEDEYVRLAAISSLGTLRATDEFDRLKSIHEDSSRIWQDRAMAIKSIGDLGTDEARAYVLAEAKRLQAAPAGNDTRWTAQIVGLYL
jgi:hypothetical protein